MKEKINEYKTLIHKTAIILKELISEKKYPDSEMLGYHFLFKYSSIYSKNDLADSSFELLEQTILLNYSNLDLNNSFFSEKNGWSLIQFVNNNFFESDDIEEILLPFDKNVIKKIEKNCFQKKIEKNCFELVKLGLYIKQRVNIIGINDSKKLMFNQYLSVILYELSKEENNTNHLIFDSLFFDCKEDLKNIGLSKKIIEDIPTLYQEFISISNKKEKISSKQNYEEDLIFSKVGNFINTKINNLAKVGNDEFCDIIILTIHLISYSENIPKKREDFYSHMFFKVKEDNF